MLDSWNYLPSASGVVKYVDDTTIYEIVNKNLPRIAQTSVNKTSTWSAVNKFLIHPTKCKELRISFSRAPTERENLKVDDQELDSVDSVKLLGVVLQ